MHSRLFAPKSFTAAVLELKCTVRLSHYRVEEKAPAFRKKCDSATVRLPPSTSEVKTPIVSELAVHLSSHVNGQGLESGGGKRVPVTSSTNFLIARNSTYTKFSKHRNQVIPEQFPNCIRDGSDTRVTSSCFEAVSSALPRTGVQLLPEAGLTVVEFT